MSTEHAPGTPDTTAQLPTHQEVHEILVEQFTDRYLRRSGLSAAAHSLPYDPNNTLCDYDRTTWPAKPNARAGLPVAKLILALTHGFGVKGRNSAFEEYGVRPFTEKIGSFTDNLLRSPVLLVSDHDPDMQAALFSVGADVAVARYDEGRGLGKFNENFKEMVRISHAVGTRGFGPVMIGPRWVPSLILGSRRSLVRTSQMVMNPHLSFPNNKRMRASDIARQFRSVYNDVFSDDMMVIVQAGVTHPHGYHPIISTPPGAAPNDPGIDQEGREIIVTAKVEQGTIDLVKALGVGLQSVRAEFGRKKGPTKVELGPYVPPGEVTDTTLATMMHDNAEFRRKVRGEGRTPVYYAEDPEVAAITD